MSQKEFERVVGVSRNELNEDLTHRRTGSADDASSRGIGKRIPSFANEASIATTHFAREQYTDREQSFIGSDISMETGSVLSNSEAERRLGLSEDDKSSPNEIHAHASRLLSYRSSFSSFRSEDMDDGEDKILFSYIRSRYRKDSWNPMASFSFEELDDHAEQRFFNSADSNYDDSNYGYEMLQPDREGHGNRSAGSRPSSPSDDYKSLTTKKRHPKMPVHSAVDSTNSANSDNRFPRSFSNDVPHSGFSASGFTAVRKDDLIRAASVDGLRTLSRTSSVERLDQLVSIPSLSPARTLSDSASTSRSGSGYAELQTEGNDLVDDTGSSIHGFQAIAATANEEQRTDSKSRESASGNHATSLSIAKQSPNQNISKDQLNREETFISSLDTNISVINSTPDANAVYDNRILNAGHLDDQSAGSDSVANQRGSMGEVFYLYLNFNSYFTVKFQ